MKLLTAFLMGFLFIAILAGCNDVGSSNSDVSAESLHTESLESELQKMSAATMDSEEDAEESDEVEENDTSDRRLPFRHRRKIIRAHVFHAVLSIVEIGEDERRLKKLLIAIKAVRQCRADIKAYWLGEFDTDGDGELNDAEKDAFKEARRGIREDIKDEYDTNQDGELDDDEKRVLGLALIAAVKASLLGKFDTNENGLISEEEVENPAEDAVCDPIYTLL